MDALEYSVCQDNGWPYRPTMQHAKESNQPSGKSSNQESTEQFDQSTDSNISWECHVTQKLLSARKYLSELFPLTYRVEILEDLFSLLFVRHEHFQTNGGGAMSDSGGEEGLVDDDWLNKSCTSLESVEIPDITGTNSEQAAQQHQGMKEVTFHRELSNVAEGQLNSNKGATMENVQRSNNPTLGILKRSNGFHANGSSEASQYSNSSLSLQGKIGFVASERFTHDVISVLKECMLDLTTAKYSQQAQQAKVDQRTSRQMTKHMKCSVKSSALAHRISKLTQHINEAWWRYQLVSQSMKSSSAPSMTGKEAFESSSDEEARSFLRETEGAEDKESGSDGKKRRKKKRNEGRSRSASGQLKSFRIFQKKIASKVIFQFFK